MTPTRIREPPVVLQDGLEAIVIALELLGVAAIVVGVVWGGFVFARRLAARNDKGAYAQLRTNLGRSILLGLELLVGADIIATVMAPLTFQSVALLGFIIVIRTFLSFALDTEIEGRWPWERGKRSDQV